MVIVPQGWEEIPGLISGFGGRGDAPAGHGLAMLKQVHGNSILAAEDVLCRDDELEGDALSVVTPGLTAAIRTADCVPILLMEPEQRWAAVMPVPPRTPLPLRWAHASSSCSSWTSSAATR